MVHVHSPKLQKAILFSWAACGVLIGAVVLNPENWVLRFTTFQFGAPNPVAVRQAGIIGGLVGGMCGLMFFMLGAAYIIQSKRDLRWLIGGVIAFLAAVPATMVHHQMFPTTVGANPIEVLKSSFMAGVVWIVPGLFWGIGWGMLENMVCRNRSRVRAMTGIDGRSAEQLEVVSRRLS